MQGCILRSVPIQCFSADRVAHPERVSSPLRSFHVKSTVTENNLDNIESQAAKLARQKQKRQKILQEKVKIERKLAAIEDQRKKVIEDYKAHKAQKAGSV